MSLIATLRPTGDLGDQSDATVTTVQGPVAGTPATGTLSVTAGAIADLDSTLYAITGVTFRAKVEHADPEQKTTGDRLTWTVGGDSDSWTVPAGFNSSLAWVTSDEQATQPNGQAWTPTAVNALTTVGAEADYILVGSELVRLSLTVAEIEVLVYGVPVPGYFRGATTGHPARDAFGGSWPCGALAGSHGADAETGSHLRGATVGPLREATVEEA